MSKWLLLWVIFGASICLQLLLRLDVTQFWDFCQMIFVFIGQLFLSIRSFRYERQVRDCEQRRRNMYIGTLS